MPPEVFSKVFDEGEAASSRADASRGQLAATLTNRISQSHKERPGKLPHSPSFRASRSSFYLDHEGSSPRSFREAIRAAALHGKE